MIKQKTTIIYFTLVLLIAIASVLILHKSGQPKKKPQKNTLNTFVNQAELINFNPKGQLKTRITALKVSHFDKDETTFFLEPRLFIFTHERIPWDIRADQAKSQRAGHSITLWGNVIIHQLMKINHPSTTIKTSEITIYPKASRAKTEKYVTIYRQDTIIHGKGLVANLKTGSYQLLAESKAVYHPKNQTVRKKTSVQKKQLFPTE